MLRYAEHLVSKGHQVTIVSARTPVECHIPNGIDVIFHKKPSRFVFYTFWLAHLLQISRCLRKDFDVVIPIHTPLAVHAIFARWRYGLNFRVILLYQDNFQMSWVGRYIKFILARRWVINNLDATVCVSNGSAEEFQRVSKILPEVVRNGIDEVFYAERKSTKRPYVLFVGRPCESKGFDVFVKAMRLVGKRFPDIKGVLVSSEVEDSIIEGIQTIRYANREQLSRLYSEALIYVHAAVGESFGLPPLEAMASGTATIVSETVGTKDYAVNYDNCLYGRYGDYETMAQNIVLLIQDEALRLRLEKNGRTTAAAYQWGNSLNQFERALMAKQFVRIPLEAH